MRLDICFSRRLYNHIMAKETPTDDSRSTRPTAPTKRKHPSIVKKPTAPRRTNPRNARPAWFKRVAAIVKFARRRDRLWMLEEPIYDEDISDIGEEDNMVRVRNGRLPAGMRPCTRYELKAKRE